MGALQSVRGRMDMLAGGWRTDDSDYGEYGWDWLAGDDCAPGRWLGGQDRVDSRGGGEST
jgi:hypothetical protein